ncbi:MAG: DUF4159 domain-containing protein [Myxococcales bacterium]|nr:DUF4159 domain-containing protein [Myxococcales bacterium]
MGLALGVISRRRLLGAGLVGAAALAWPRRARAIGPGSKFRVGQLALGAPQPRPDALRRLLWELDKRTSIAVDLEAPTVAPTAPTLHETPFLYLAGDREFAVPSPAGVEALRRFLTFGGFLLIDSAEGTTDGAFDKSVRALCAALYPTPAPGLELVPADHVVYKAFYLLERPLGRLALSPVMEGITRSGRLTVAYVQNDLGGAWTKDNFGNYAFPCEPDGDRQRELAYRMGVNLAMYALCLDYKTDQVHVPFIMRRRRWRPDDGAQTPAAPPTPPKP